MSNLNQKLLFILICLSLSSCQTIKKAGHDLGRSNQNIKNDITKMSNTISTPITTAINETLKNFSKETTETKSINKSTNSETIPEEDMVIILEGLSELYYLGEYGKALKLAQKYEYTNHPTILNYFGLFYHYGSGIKQNFKKASFYYDKAIKNGSTFAYSNMGLLYEEGDGVEVDLSKALSLHKKGHDLKNYFSTYNLGRFYFFGIGIEKNTNYGLQLLREADQNEEEQATILLGDIYFEGDGIKKDYKLAMKYYRKAAQIGNDAMPFHRLGYMYDLGHGVDINPDLALEFYFKAVEYGSADSAYNIGLIYFDKESKHYDIFKALKYFKKAKEMGDNLADIKIDIIESEIKNKKIVQNNLDQDLNKVRGLVLKNKKENLINPNSFHALIISIKDYQYLDDLKTPINDGKVIGELLKKKYGFQINYLQNPTRDGITQALNKLQKKLKPVDNLLIYYAGHGIEINNDGYWLPKNANKNDDTHWLSNDYLTRKIKNMKASNILVLSDSCYSGTLTRSLDFSNDDKKPLSVYLNTKSRMVITSGGLSPVLDSGGAGHSVFARFLINYLSTSTKNFTATDLYSSINKKVTQLSSNLGITQVPVLASLPRSGHVGPDFVFIQK